jgi:hypothetical protein
VNQILPSTAATEKSAVAASCTLDSNQFTKFQVLLYLEKYHSLQTTPVGPMFSTQSKSVPFPILPLKSTFSVLKVLFKWKKMIMHCVFKK